MAPSSISYLFLHSLLPTLLLNLLLARLAASTLMNPTLRAHYVCLPPSTANKPVRLACIRAMLALPHTQQGIDYHTVPITSGRNNVVYDTTLTSIGNPDSLYHLPRTSEAEGCRVTVRMAEGVHFARVLWMDVQQSTMTLINRCVDDGRVLSWRPGSGAGGSTSIGAVMISVEAVGSPASLGMTGGVDTLNGPAPGTSYGRIGANLSR